MIRTTLLLAIAALGMSACRDDGTADPLVPTPAPTATPSSSDSGSGSSSDGSGSSSGTSATPTPTPAATSSGSGAGMSSTSEEVRVTAFRTGVAGNAGDSVLEVTRTDGEVWRFTLTVTPNTAVGQIVTYNDADRIFGAADGNLFFSDGSSYSYTSATRIQ